MRLVTGAAIAIIRSGAVLARKAGVVVLGVPEPGVAEAVGEACQVEALPQRLAGAGAGGAGDEVEDGEGERHGGRYDGGCDGRRMLALRRRRLDARRTLAVRAWGGSTLQRSRELDDAFVAARFQAHRACPGCPSAPDVAAWFGDTLGFVFPEHATRRVDDLASFRAFGDELGGRLVGLVHDCPDATAFAATVADRFLEGLATLHARLEEDADAIVAGDPAAWSRSEVIRSYPGFYAIAAHRVAHALLEQGARMLARMIAGHAHRNTGIDIHPPRGSGAAAASTTGRAS
jgi:hypothetical protein